MRVDKAEQEDIVVSKHPRTNGEFRCAAMMALAGLEAYILKFRRESSSSVSCFKVFSFSANYQKVRVFAFINLPPPEILLSSCGGHLFSRLRARTF